LGKGVNPSVVDITAPGLEKEEWEGGVWGKIPARHDGGTASKGLFTLGVWERRTGRRPGNGGDAVCHVYP